MVAGTVELYFREISSMTLLSADDEIRLAREIEQGDDARRELARTPYLSDQRRRELEDIAANGERARRRLMEANLRLVVSVARKYLNRGLPMLDLIQEGNLGLGRAVEKFDWRKGYRFSTYACWWIRQAITRAVLEQGRAIRMPTQAVAAIGALNRASQELEQELGREPRIEQLAERLQLSADKVHELISAKRQPVSLERPLNPDESSVTLRDVLPDHAARSPHEQAAASILKRHVADAMQILSPREKSVLRMHYGLDGGREHTLAEIADVLGVTSERVRQIETAALAKLRSPKLRYKLREYLDEYVVNSSPVDARLLLGTGSAR
jgi:RNA polymerase primary sigma factor